MKTDVITISNDGKNMEAVLDQVEKACTYKGLSPKNALSLRLLTEEMMALMRAVTGDVSGEFWMEDRDQVYELHLLVRTLIDDEMRKQLLSASSSGKNEASRGFMGKIRAFFQPAAGVPMFPAGYAGGSPQMYGSMSWSMGDYRNQLRQYDELNRKKDQEAWDELEKSVVAKVADDVKVSILGKTVEMTILKKLA